MKVISGFELEVRLYVVGGGAWFEGRIEVLFRGGVGFVKEVWVLFFFVLLGFWKIREL